MKPLFTRVLALICLLVGCPVAQARIGETEKQCEARYGKPTKSDEGQALRQYLKAGWIVEAHFFEGKCDAIAFTKFEKEAGKTISENERDVLLQASGGERDWESAGRNGMVDVFRTKDGELAAQYDNSSCVLAILTREAAKRRSDEEKAATGAKLKGF